MSRRAISWHVVCSNVSKTNSTCIMCHAGASLHDSRMQIKSRLLRRVWARQRHGIGGNHELCCCNILNTM